MNHERVIDLALQYAAHALLTVKAKEVAGQFHLDPEDAEEVARAVRQHVEPGWVGY